MAAGDPWDEREYVMYPPAEVPLRRTPSGFGRDRYTALGVARDDWEARPRAAIGNWDCFGAPVALFCYIDRDLGLPQWSDLGMYLQTVMLLLRAEGLHSCPQMAWSRCEIGRRGDLAAAGTHAVLRHVDRVRGPRACVSSTTAGRRSRRR